MHKSLSTAAIVLATTIGLSAPLMAHDRGDTFVVTPNQVVDMADAKIAQFKADLRLTPDQNKNWGDVQKAMHDMAQRRADRMNQMREQRSAQTTSATAPATANPPADNANSNANNTSANNANSDRPDAIAGMRRQADALAAKSDDLKKFADSAGPLYNSLNDDQRAKFVAFVDHNMVSDQGPGGYGYGFQRSNDADRDWSRGKRQRYDRY
jgi:hypothetical protein